MSRKVAWEDLTTEERNTLVAGVLEWTPVEPTEKPPSYDIAATSLRLIEHLIAERQIRGMEFDFMLGADAWSFFFETTIAGATEQIHVVGDSFYDAVAKGALTLHDVDVDLLYTDHDGSPTEQRALDALKQPVARILGWMLLADMEDELLTAYRRLDDVAGMTRDTISSLLARELSRLAVSRRPKE